MSSGPIVAERQRYRANIQDEIDSAYLYQAVADLEPSPPLAEVYRRLAATEQKHARFWQEKLRAAGDTPPDHPTWRARTLVALARRFGASFILPTLTDLERGDSKGYAAQPESRDTPMSAEEQSHATVLRAIATQTRGGIEGSALARFEGRHRAAGGNALRAAVLGANDGLVSNLSLIMGVAGAVTQGHEIVIAGMAGLLAGACSMAMGEWISVQSSRELYERQLSIESAELTHAPQEEQQELALIYQAKGLPQAQADAFAAKLVADRDSALDALAREELGIDPQELGGSAVEAAATSFVLFALGAVVPLFPFFLLTGIPAIVASLVVSTIGLFGIGAGITLMTGRSVVFSGMRMVLIGLAAALVTFFIGRLIGVTLAG
jgi:VIT1/CCC1 family predicted Fe2+/Mn2+ transporter